MFLTQPDPGYYFSGLDGHERRLESEPVRQHAGLRDPFQQRADVTPIFATCPAGQSCLTVVATPAGTGSVAGLGGRTPVSHTDVSTGKLWTYCRQPGDVFTIVADRNERRRAPGWNGCTDERRPSCTVTVAGYDVVTTTFSDEITVDKSDVVEPSKNIALALFDTTGDYFDDEAGDGCVPTVTTCVYDAVPGTSYSFLRGVGIPSSSGSYSNVTSWTGCTPEGGAR